MKLLKNLTSIILVAVSRNKIYRILIVLAGITVIFPSTAITIYRISSYRNPYYHYLMGRIYIHKGEIKKGIRGLERALNLDKDSWVIKWDLLELYYITRDYQKALKLAKKMYEIRPEDVPLIELLADIHAKTGEPDKALEIYKKLVELEPLNYRNKLNVAALYEDEKDYKSALIQYVELIKKEPKNSYVRLALADTYLKLNKYNAAIRNYLEALKYGADKKEVYLQVSSVYNHIGKRNKAEKYLKGILATDPEDTRTLYLLAEVYQDGDQFKKAEEILLRIKEISGDNIDILLRMGTLYSSMEKITESEKMFKKVTELYPEEFAGWYFLGLTYEYQEKYDLAKDSLLKSVQIKETAQVYFHLGVINDKKGDFDKAVKMLKKCLEIEPKHSGASNYLGYSWAEKGINLKQAKELILKANEEDPNNPAYIDSLGWVYYQEKEYEQALQELKKASDLIEDPIIYEHLGDTYLKIDRKNKAEKAYKKALKLEPDNKKVEQKIDDINK